MTIYDYQVKTRDGKDLSLKNLRGKVLLIVNTATGCGFISLTSLMSFSSLRLPDTNHKSSKSFC